MSDMIMTQRFLEVLTLEKYPTFLRQVAEPIEIFEHDGLPIQNLIDNMVLTMRRHRGVGLAAPQIGVSRRLIVMEHIPINGHIEDFFSLTVMINPVILGSSREMHQQYEGCLSIGAFKGLVTRPAMVWVEYLDAKGESHKAVAKHLFATCIQHEIDHLDGILFIDKLDGPLIPMNEGAL